MKENVAATLGPKGRNVILHKKDYNPIITKDGVTVAKFFDLEDPFENAGAQILKQASARTNTLAGDGTTTSTVLAYAIFEQAQKYIVSGASPTELKRGIDKAVEVIIENLKEMSRPVSSKDDIEHIATISANGDTSIGELIATAVDQAGKDGAISIEDGRTTDTSLDVVEGFRFDSGYFANAFITNERRASVEYNEALLLVTDYSIENVQEILPTLEVVAREGQPLVVIAEQIEGQALAALIMNAVRGTMRVAAVKAPRYGQERRNILKDLCVSVGATFVSRESGIKLSEVGLKHLGKCKKIEILKNNTTIVGGTNDWEEVETKIEILKAELKQSESVDEQRQLQDRITRLASGIAIIHVGAATEIEMIEKRHRIEDALEAVKSAQELGVVPGGGVALLRATQGLLVDTENEEQALGVEIIKKAASSPVQQMSYNANVSADLVLKDILSAEGDVGYDFSTDQLISMYEAGIIDPAKVTIVALQNAASVASVLLTTNNAIIEV